MINGVKDVLLAAVGGAALSAEKAEGIVKNLVDKGKLTVDEGKNLTQELIKRDKTTPTAELDRDELQATLIEMNFAQQEDIKSLDREIQDLKSEINDLKDELTKK